MSGNFEDYVRRRGHGPGTGTGPGAEPAPETRSEEAEGYLAYGVTRGQQAAMLDLRWWTARSHAQGEMINYAYLVKMLYTGDDYLSLVTSSSVIAIQGKNLGELRRRIATREVEFVQMFNPNVWDAPDEGAPIVTSIQTYDPRAGATTTSADVEH